MDELRPYRAMAFNNLWANHRLLTACAALSQAEWVAPRTGFFPSLRATLNHILIIDHFYVDAMEGGTLGPAAWANREPCATLPRASGRAGGDGPAPDRRGRGGGRGCRQRRARADRQRASRRPHPARAARPAAAASVPAPEPTIAARLMPCSAGRRWRRRSSTSSFRTRRRRCGPESSQRWGSARRGCGVRGARPGRACEKPRRHPGLARDPLEGSGALRWIPELRCFAACPG